jgi:sucrose-6-phosphate hydrolase SacC (GH32 family)
VPIRVHQQELEVGGAWAPLAMLEDEATLRLHVFLDKSVLEVYANRRVCLTRVIDAGADHLGLELFASGGAVHVQELDVWHIPSD